MKKLLIYVSLALSLISFSLSTKADAAVAFVQAASTTVSFSVSHMTATFHVNVTANNMIAWGTESDLGPITNVTSSCVTGNLTIVGSSTNSGSGNPVNLAYGYGLINASGACSVTVNGPNASQDLGIVVHEVSGVATTNPVDASSSRANTLASSWSSGTSTTATAGDYIFGMLDLAGFTDTPTQGTGYTKRVLVTSNMFTEDQVQAAAGAISANGTVTGTDGASMVAGMLALKPIPASGGATNALSNSMSSGILNVSNTTLKISNQSLLVQ